MIIERYFRVCIRKSTRRVRSSRPVANGSASTPASRSYTIGQRTGLPASSDGARYVTRIDAATNTLVVGREDELLCDELDADDINLIRPERFRGGDTVVRAMIRYRAAPAPALATVRDDGSLRLRFATPQRAVTPGQLVALLDPASEEVLGGATIATERNLSRRFQ